MTGGMGPADAHWATFARGRATAPNEDSKSHYFLQSMMAVCATYLFQ